MLALPKNYSTLPCSPKSVQQVNTYQIWCSRAICNCIVSDLILLVGISACRLKVDHRKITAGSNTTAYCGRVCLYHNCHVKHQLNCMINERNTSSCINCTWYNTVCENVHIHIGKVIVLNENMLLWNSESMLVHYLDQVHTPSRYHIIKSLWKQPKCWYSD